MVLTLISNVITLIKKFLVGLFGTDPVPYTLCQLES